MTYNMFQNISKLSIKIFSGCNLACIFCHQLTSDKTASELFIDIDNLEKQLYILPFSDIVDVTITGGEVTMQPDHFEKIAKIFKKVERNREVKFDLCLITNGTNMEVVYDWCDRGLIVPHKTAISWDGLYSASKSRLTKGKYNDEFFKKVIYDVGQSRYNKYICITHSLTPQTISTLAESFQYCLDVNALNFGYYFIHEGNYSNETFVNEFENQITQIAKKTVNALNSGVDLSYYNWQLIYTKRKKPNNFYICGKLGNNIHIDLDGQYYPCIYFGDHNTFSLGNITDGLDKNELQRFERELSVCPKCDFKKCNNLQCSECPASCYVHKKSLAERFCNQCHILPIETQIYDEYANTINDLYKKANLYIPKDEYMGDRKINLQDSENAVYNDDYIEASPQLERVKKW